MGLIETKHGRTILKKAESMMAVPYVYDATIGDYVLGQDVYDISAVIGDSIVIEQSEGNTDTKYNEFVGSPLLECVSGAKYAFTAQCVDLQNSVLKSIFGAMTASGKMGAVEGAAAFQDDFVRRYALIRVRFHEDDMPDVILPKVKLNSKLFINQLKTRCSQGNIAGTAFSINVAIEDNLGSMGGTLQFSDPATNSTTYTPYTPVIFVPKTHTPLFFHHEEDGDHYYSLVNFSTGVVTHSIVVGENGGWTAASENTGGGGSSSSSGSGTSSGSENNNEE